MKIFTSNSQKIGKLGEDISCIYLKKHGFTIRDRNYTQKWGEIDIVAEKDNKLYFIEVKSVSRSLNKNDEYKNQTQETPNYFRPEENMHPWKMKRLARTIETYLIHNRIGNISWQFDVILVFLDTKERKAKVEVLKNIIL